MSNYFIRILLVLMTIAGYPGFAATPRVIPIGPSEYHAANINWAAAQDDHGFTYFANDMGLLEFDGLGWKLYALPNSSVIRAVAALSHKTIFTGSFEEFGRWDRDRSGTLHYTSLVPEERKLRPSNSEIWKIYITPQGVIFQSFHELYLYDYHTVRKIDPGRNLLFLLRGEQDMWIQQMGGPLLRFDGERFDPVLGSDRFGSSDVRVLLTLPEDGQRVVGTSTMGLWRHDGERFTEWNRELSAVMKRDELNCGIQTSRGTYLLGTLLNGIYEVDEEGRILQHLSTRNKLANNSIMSLMEDESRNIWVLTDRGLAYLVYHDNIDYHTSPEWPYGSVYDATMWQDKLFIATNQGVFYISPGQLGRSGLPSEFHRVPGIQGQVWSLSVADDRLWCCHNFGVMEIGRNLTARRAYDMGGYRLRHTRLGDRDLALYASYYQLRLLDLGTGTMYEMESIPESFSDVEVDHMQNIWLEHPIKGVYKCRLNPDLRTASGVKFYGGDSGDGLPYKLRVFRVGGRVVLMGGDRFFTYNDIQDRIEPDSLLNACFEGVDGLRRVVPIGNNSFWVLAKAGAYKLRYDGYSASLTPCPGIPPGNLVYGYENVAVLNDSTSVFCCDNGFIIHHEGTSSESDYHPASPTIETIGASNEQGLRSYFATDESARIPYNKNFVTLRFAARKALADDLSFRYRLNGVDGAWTTHNTSGEATYARLPKGRYTFEVASEDRFGNLSEPTFMDIEILTPWYTSAWAYAGYTLLAMLLIYGTWLILMHRYRVNYLRKLRHREIISLRATNKELCQELEIRDAEIFSQSSMLIAKNELITRIRDMVEDFTHKQGNKALTPLYYKINTFISSNLDTDNDWKLFLIKFEQKHAGFFRILKERYPELTSSDLRLCACLKLQLDSKEIASLMNISVRAVENSRYRLRKKLGLNQSQNLNDFLMEIEPEADSADCGEDEKPKNTNNSESES